MGSPLKAYLVTCGDLDMETGVVWGTTRGKAMWRVVTSYCDAGWGTERDALKAIRLMRSRQYDQWCPDERAVQSWDKSYIDDRILRIACRNRCIAIPPFSGEEARCTQ